MLLTEQNCVNKKINMLSLIILFHQFQMTSPHQPECIFTLSRRSGISSNSYLVGSRAVLSTRIKYTFHNYSGRLNDQRAANIIFSANGSRHSGWQENSDKAED
jgi:hypothetical protein